MNKTYHRRVFGGRSATFDGIDQGKGVLHPEALEMSLNATFDDNVFKTRSGQARVESDLEGSILCAKNTATYTTIMSGTDVFIWDDIVFVRREPIKLLDADGFGLVDSDGKQIFVLG